MNVIGDIIEKKKRTVEKKGGESVMKKKVNE